VSEERRSVLREPFSQPITAKAERDGKTVTFQAEVVDVSSVGARIRSMTRLDPGDTIEFFSADDPAHPARYIVAWAGRKGTDLEGEIGLRIINPEMDGR